MVNLLVSFLLVGLSLDLANSFIPIRLDNRPPPPSVSEEQIKLITIQNFPYQRLDHFNSSDERIWAQRYFVNNKYYKLGGPVFLFIEGEGEAKCDYIVGGNIVDNAAKFGALLVCLEHRYYGQSHPTEDMSTANLKYLSSEQALADIDYFLEFFLRFNAKVVAWGGSYAGSLAAWARLKYPNRIHSAVSSSAPLLAIADFADYLGVVYDSIKSSTNGDACIEAIHKGTVQFTNLLNSNPNKLKTDWNLCNDIDTNNAKDISLLYETIAGMFAGTVQKDKFMNSINNVCNTMINTQLGTELERLEQLRFDEYGEGCLEFRYTDNILQFQQDKWSASSSGRLWIYQTCTEFGFYQTTALDKVKYLFTGNFLVNFFLQQCPDIYGSSISISRVYEGIKNTNQYYGALDIKVDRVVFVHGSVDPWHALGLINSSNSRAPSIFIEGTSHCADMGITSSADPTSLQQARKLITKYLETWLNEE